jgi:recombination protein RecT
MNNQVAVSNQREITTFISKRKNEISKLLPSHISIDLMERAILNAMMRTPDLAHCDKLSVYDSVLRCAQDGLLPDGREASIVVYNQKGIKKAQYIPMIDGILKRLRQSGAINNITAKVVYDCDSFDYFVDENGEHIIHKPKFGVTEKKIVLVYAYARLSNGELVVEVMEKSDVDRVRGASRSGGSAYSPWSNWYDRMALKSVLHRLARRLPTSSEVYAVRDMIEREIDADFGEKEIEKPIKPFNPVEALETSDETGQENKGEEIENEEILLDDEFDPTKF